jgi:predicted dehydrogenase
MPQQPKKGCHVGIIGCGNFAYSNLAYYLQRNYGAVIQGVMDRDIQHAASLFEKWGANYYTDDPDRLFEDKNIDLYFIASNHASHAEYAIRALELGRSVHIEKPHVVTYDQLVRLCRAIRSSQGAVNLGFNRPISRFGLEIKCCLDAQSGPAMFNWFIAGHEIDASHWYFDEEEGGRVLGNLCHWTDFTYQMVAPENRYPIIITPTRAATSDCDIAVSYLFGDGSIASITFSAKGHTFEGVRERFAAHRGNALIFLDDFKTLTIEIAERKQHIRSFYRHHGHEEAVRRSYASVHSGASCTLDYIWETGELFLKTKEALDKNSPMRVERFSESKLGTAK